MPTDCIGATLLRDKTAELLTAEKNAKDALNVILDDLMVKLNKDLCCVKLPTITGMLWWKKLAYKPVKIEKKSECVKIGFDNAFFPRERNEHIEPFGDIHSRILVSQGVVKGLKVYHWRGFPRSTIDCDNYEEALQGVILFLSQYAQEFASEHRKYLK
jgi:hypothetical protein